MPKRDPLFDAMILGLRLDPSQLTRSARGRINSALKELREVGATPEQLRSRINTYRRMWPHATCTATAIAANWAVLAPRHVETATAERVLQDMLAVHQQGTPQRDRAERYVEKLTTEQRNDPSIRAIMVRFDPWRIGA